LHVAAEAGNVTAARLLVDSGADLFAREKGGYTALELAQMTGHQAAAQYLLEKIEQQHLKLRDMRSSESLRSFFPLHLVPHLLLPHSAWVFCRRRRRPPSPLLACYSN
jgi:ankyrin repeat protein